MRLFDTHCHFDFSPFRDDFSNQLAEANQAGVERFLIPAIGSSNWSQLQQLALDNPQIYIALGFHPYFLDAQAQSQLEQLDALLAAKPFGCVAVGECGLDGMVDIGTALQEKLFIEQIKLANQHRLPLVLHTRKTHNRLLQLLKQQGHHTGGILHGFSGSYQQAKQFVDLGFYIGVGGVITYPRANKTRQAVAKLPLDSLVLETDAPDMPLMGYQGQINHPKRLPLILDILAQLQNNDAQTIAEIVWRNGNLALNICE
ncbi:TatD family hydrolase [Vibrio intestinalis]|uniref:TatD family hydrolase n=1 Tax=Vibrio intestinalis TaxID=2933291 RepID=UPI0021A682B4|nr:TatD family hydrolase [Vibrio intestinalis]